MIAAPSREAGPRPGRSAAPGLLSGAAVRSAPSFPQFSRRLVGPGRLIEKTVSRSVPPRRLGGGRRIRVRLTRLLVEGGLPPIFGGFP